jgi:hypothetical protein
MKSFFRLISQLKAWLGKRFRHTYRTHVIEGDLPEKLQRRTIYVVKEDGYLENVSMICPCGCGQILHMNLIPDERPCWQITEHRDGTISLHPSVWRKKGCKSHFWFRHGQVHWCRTV